jgi:hypothetical protein
MENPTPDFQSLSACFEHLRIKRAAKYGWEEIQRNQDNPVGRGFVYISVLACCKGDFYTSGFLILKKKKRKLAILSEKQP